MDRSTLSSPNGEASSSSTLSRINGIQNLAQQFRRLRGTNSPSLKESLIWESKSDTKFDVLYSENGTELCTFCYNLNEAAFQNHASFIRALKYFLRNSGCKTCLMIKRGISQFMSVDGAEDLNVEISAGAEDGVMILVAGLKMEFFTTQRQSGFGKMIKTAQPVPQDSQSDQAFVSIKAWIKECIKDHPLCPLNESSLLPKRLIDVGGKGKLEPRIYESYGESGRYLSLSHRWGTSLITTTKKSITSGQKGIAWAKFPKVFQDAIMITRQLGVRYLWIDSLCIIQDDTDDWLEQSAQMASIYAGSYVTIAATASENSKSKCLSLTGRSTDSKQISGTSIIVRKSIQHGQIYSSQEYDSAYPLFSRAWCFQERLLATRVLHYTKDEIVFECRTGYRCECGNIWRGNDKVVSGCLKLAYAQILDESRSLGRGDRYLGSTFSSLCNKETLLWNRVVREYTKKQMTYERDTLPALSGVADRMPVDLTGKYLAGLWEQDLIYGLLWTSEHGLKCHRHHTFIAPSFSWASRSGPVAWPAFTSRYKARASILDASCDLRDKNPTGEVLAGFVKLRGALTALTFHGVNDTSTNNTCAVKKGGFQEEANVMIDTLEDAQLPAATPVHCLSILEYGWENYMSLVLKACPGGFERIGVANAVPGSWFKNAQSSEVWIV